MLNFAEQTGSGAVMLVWSFPLLHPKLAYTNTITQTHTQTTLNLLTYFLEHSHQKKYLLTFNTHSTGKARHYYLTTYLDALPINLHPYTMIMVSSNGTFTVNIRS